MLPRCPICKSSRLMSLYEKYFCETCDVYLTLSLEPCALPIPNALSQTDLCDACAKLPTTTIKCRHFRDYMRQHIFCKCCKEKLCEYFQHHFYKYFSLYRVEQRVCGWFYATLLFVCICASFRYKYLALVVLFSKEALCGVSYTSLWKLAVVLVYRSPVVYAVLAAVMFDCLRQKVEVYGVPTRFDDFDIQEHISRLKISKDGEARARMQERVYSRRHTPFSRKLRAECKTHSSFLEKKIRNLKI